MYPFYERLVKWSKTSPGIVNVCIHKGLFPPSVEKQFPHLLAYSDVRDVGKAAKDWPQLNFVIYHSGWRWTGPDAPNPPGSNSRRRAASSGSPTSRRFRRSSA